MNTRVPRLLALAIVALFLTAAPAAAQLRATQYVTGLTSPVEFVQDPTDPAVQYVVEQGGRVRVIRNGVIQATDFINLSGSIVAGGEQGLLGMAFPPNHATTGRVFFYFNVLGGDIVVARFRKNGPTTADPLTRFDLVWNGVPFIEHSEFGNHNGGHLAFGPDGNLYIGVGDGGSGNDPHHNAQNPATLLGKMLRVDVSVADSDPIGYRIPTGGNPTPVPGTLPQIWAFGLRNPWKFTFDEPSRGGTGAMFIGDVGQNAWEEIDYQPPGVGGLNYGWRNREGAHDNVTSLPPAYTPLTDPIFELDRTSARSVTGGYRYRGAGLGSQYFGRYVFGDFITGRIWSLAIAGNGAASDLREHTAELATTPAIGNISSFGVDAAGEIYIVSYGGTIFKIQLVSQPAMSLDTPLNGARVVAPFPIAGWAIDAGAATGTGVDAIHVWAYPNPGSNAAPIFVGAAGYGGNRADVGGIFGARFAPSGFSLVATGPPPGFYRLTVFARSTVTNAFSIVRTADITVLERWAIAVEAPLAGQTLPQPFQLSGWAADMASTSGTGVDALHVWAFPNPGSGQPPVFVGIPTYGIARPDVAAAFGARFRDSGFRLTVRGLLPGSYRFVVYAHSSTTGAFEASRTLDVTAASNPFMAIDGPPNNATVTRPFVIGGWAVDIAAATGTGVDAVHIWAFPDAGGTPVFLGVGAFGARPDVGAIFGTQFNQSGYSLTVSSLAPGSYQIVVYAHSTVTGTFNQSLAVRVRVQ